MKNKVAYEVTIHGIVQGVGFRYFVYTKALHVDVYGWVRNCADGTVKIVCEGMEPVLNDFLIACSQGPPLSRVSNIEKIKINTTGYNDFRIL